MNPTQNPDDSSYTSISTAPLTPVSDSLQVLEVSEPHDSVASLTNVQAAIDSVLSSQGEEVTVAPHELVSPVASVAQELTPPIVPVAPIATSVPHTPTPTVEILSEIPLPKTQMDPLTTNMPNSEVNDALKKSQYFNNSIFWIEVEKIVPNPYQPRKEFDQHALRDLADSIRMYGLLQPLVVTRKEITKEDGGLAVQYELISGERRLRASKLSGLLQVPVIIRAGEEDARVKLELAIIENLQREDLNPVDRARSFQRLSDEFGLKHAQIAEKMGKSREYVTNSIRLLALPAHMLEALGEKKISEGHTRPLLMLIDRPEEQEVLFREICLKKMTVREAERIARGVAVERVRKHDQTPELKDLEKQLNQAFGTRVFIEKKEQGGKIVIDFFDAGDVRNIIELLNNAQEANRKPHNTVTSAHAYNSVSEMMSQLTAATPLESSVIAATPVEPAPLESASAEVDAEAGKSVPGVDQPVDDSTEADKSEDDSMYSIKNFSI